MTIKISRLIELLQQHQERYGDHPVYTVDSDIADIKCYPCKDGVSSTTDGIQDDYDELVLEVVPCP